MLLSEVTHSKGDLYSVSFFFFFFAFLEWNPWLCLYYYLPPSYSELNDHALHMRTNKWSWRCCCISKSAQICQPVPEVLLPKRADCKMLCWKGGGNSGNNISHLFLFAESLSPSGSKVTLKGLITPEWAFTHLAGTYHLTRWVSFLFREALVLRSTIICFAF